MILFKNYEFSKVRACRFLHVWPKPKKVFQLAVVLQTASDYKNNCTCMYTLDPKCCENIRFVALNVPGFFGYPYSTNSKPQRNAYFM